VAELAPLQAILHLWACDSPAASALRPETISEVLRDEVESILPLLRAARQTAAPPRLWVATQTAQLTGPEDRLGGLAQAPLWGLGRSLALEVPELWGGIIDLPVGAPTQDQAETLVDVLYGAFED